jgi:hypothetical protein
MFSIIKNIQKKFLYRVIVLFGLLFSLSMYAISEKEESGLAEWTVLAYIQADNNLAPFSVYNMSDIQKVAFGDKVHMLAQWHKPYDGYIHRYKFIERGFIEDGDAIKQGTPNPEQEVVDAMVWAKKNYPARHYMLILWNHGNGILDQPLARRSEIGGQHVCVPWLEVPGLDLYDHRGILYSETTHAYMTNKQLAGALHTIKEEILGQKIDILGMDACLMAMLEVAYQVKDYANILVASQNSEPGHGWYYENFLTYLAKSPSNVSPIKLAKKIVSSYDQYYKKIIPFYTQSAINLCAINRVKENLDNVVMNLMICRDIDPEKTRSMVFTARRISLKFDTEAYIDQHSFYSSLLKIISKKLPSKKKIIGKKTRTCKEVLFEKALNDLSVVLNKGLFVINDAVHANVAAMYFQRAKGISVYFPKEEIHHSYYKTKFAKQSLWKDFLETIRI